MAFTSTVTQRTVFGDAKVVYGTFTNTSGSTGGDIATGLNTVDFISLAHTGSAVVASDPVANETFPFSGGDVTIVTVADADGLYMAVGR